MYDNAQVRHYNLGARDFGTGAAIAIVVDVPVDSGGVGRSGRVVYCTVGAVAEDFAGSTSDAGVQVGDGTDVDKYYDTGLVLDETVDASTLIVHDLVDDGSKVDIEYNRSTVTVTLVPADGTETGQATVELGIEWD